MYDMLLHIHVCRGMHIQWYCNLQSVGTSTLYLKPLMRMSKLDCSTMSIPVDLAILVPSVLYRAALHERGRGERQGRERELNTSSSGQPMVARHDAWFTKLGFLASVMINHAKIFPLQCIHYVLRLHTPSKSSYYL